jgi:hypothetical protein
VAATTITRKGNTVSQNPGVVSILEEETCVQKLAELFPNVSPVRIGVRVFTISAGREQLQEQAVIEFATAREVVFGSNLPLEFEDSVRLVNSDGSLDVQATVVAVRYHAGRKAVAARFVTDVKNWIVKP